jgi:hypothetical protein
MVPDDVPDLPLLYDVYKHMRSMQKVCNLILMLVLEGAE